MTAVSTKAEHFWIDHAVRLGCVVCRNLGQGATPAVFHHLRLGMGAAMRNGNAIGIPLCPTHHQGGGHGVSYHDGPKTFERMYGTELELLNQTILEVSESLRTLYARPARAIPIAGEAT